MCGIAGIVSGDRLHPDDRTRAERMRDVLAHRGPDGAGTYADAQAALVHRRLSIIDVAAGHQPMSNEDATVWITFNGEIYNHAELRSQLEAAGHRYRTRTDTETILHAYEQWGDDCVDRFRGMFAFGVWDTRKRRLLLVRDRLGIKPLYWTLASGRLLFASEIKGILNSSLVAARPNRAVLPEMLATRYTSGTETLFEGIHKLLPGHRLVYEDGSVRIDRYWDLPLDGPDPELERQDERTLVDRFRALLQESVRLRLMADVPLGVFLSGGIDSSAIAAMMAREVDRPIEAFSVAFSDRAFSELEYARLMAREIGARHHEVVIDDGDFFEAFPRLLWHEDEPIAHPSSVPLHFVSALARERVKVVLTGEGSDELLAGYGKYPRALFNWRAGGFYERLVPAGVRSRLATSIVERMPGRAGRLSRRSFLAMPRRPEAMFFDNFAGVPLRTLRAVLDPSVMEGAEPYTPSLDYFTRVNGNSSTLARLLYTDVKTYLVELLMKQDQMSMSMSIESRVPFLDHKLVEFAARLPDRLKLNGFATKHVLRRALQGLVPAAILERGKMGFPVPFASWVRGPWHGMARDVLLDQRTRERGLTNPLGVSQLLQAHKAGRTAAGDVIWALLNLELWHRTFIDGDGIQTLPAPDRQTAPASQASAATQALPRSIPLPPPALDLSASGAGGATPYTQQGLL